MTVICPGCKGTGMVDVPEDTVACGFCQATGECPEDLMVAALFVDPKGPYAKRPGVDAWTEERDARKFKGKCRVVTHSPCQRWGRFAEGSPSNKRYKAGDDGGCAEFAVRMVRENGGVFEHPQGSLAWKAFKMPIPPEKGWSPPDEHGGRSCEVDQGAYGHKAKKATWLYAVLPAFPELNWEKVWGRPYIGGDGFHSAAERRRAKARAGYKPKEQIPVGENHLTPEPFAKLLLSLARIPGTIKRYPRQVALPAIGKVLA